MSSGPFLEKKRIHFLLGEKKKSDHSEMALRMNALQTQILTQIHLSGKIYAGSCCELSLVHYNGLLYQRTCVTS